REAVKPLVANPALRKTILEVKKAKEQVIDTVSVDVLKEAGFSSAAKEAAKNLITSFEKYIEEHKDEITALQVMYSQPYKKRLKLQDIEDLANQIKRPPRSWTPDRLWTA